MTEKTVWLAVLKRDTEASNVLLPGSQPFEQGVVCLATDVGGSPILLCEFPRHMGVYAIPKPLLILYRNLTQAVADGELPEYTVLE